MFDITIAVATVPVMLLMLLIYRKDMPKKEPIGLLAKAFCFGALSILPAVVIEWVLSGLTLYIWDDFAMCCYEAFVVAGLTEECCKMAFLFLAVWRRREFDEYFDGIVYSAFVALGFAFFENLGYIFGMGSHMAQVATGITRGVLAVPAHFLFGVTMGYFVAHFRFDGRRRGLYLALALIVPVLLHGVYDVLLLYSDTLEEGPKGGLMRAGLFFIFAGFDMLMWLWGLNRIRRLRRISQARRHDGMDRQGHFTDYGW